MLATSLLATLLLADHRQVEIPKELAGQWALVENWAGEAAIPKVFVEGITATAAGDYWVFQLGEPRSERDPAGIWCMTYYEGNRLRRDYAVFNGTSPFQTPVAGIYKLEGDKLTLALVNPDQPEPSDFKPGKGKWVEVWRRFKHRIKEGQIEMPPELSGRWRLVKRTVGSVITVNEPLQESQAVAGGNTWVVEYARGSPGIWRISFYKDRRFGRVEIFTNGLSVSTSGDGGPHGVYKVDGDKLYFGNSEKSFSPDFVPSENAWVEIWERIKAEKNDPPPADQPKPTPKK